MKIKNDSVRIQIGNKKYDFHNLILNEYIKRLINKQLSKEVATNSNLTKSTKLTYLLLKLDTPINNINQDSVLTNYDFDITIVHRASIKQDISEKQVVIQYDYSILVNDYVIDLKTAQLGKDSSETIKQLADFYDRKITAIGFTTHWYPYKEVPVCAVLDTSNYSIFLERNQDLTISRKDIITTDAEFSTNNKEKVKGPAHLSPLGLPQIIYQPSIVQTLKDDEGNDYIKKHEFYDYAKGVLTSVGLSQNPNYIEKEYKIGEDIQAVNNETEIEINGIINDEKEEGNVYPSYELFPIEPRTLPIQSSKGIKETSIKTNEENDFFVNIDGRSTQDGTPTPNNLVEIKSIGDDINLFDESALSGYTDRGITWNYDNTTKKVNISGTASSSYSQTNYLRLSLRPGTYYFSIFGDTSLKYGIWFYNSDNKLIGTIKASGSEIITEDVAKIGLYVEGLTSGNNYLKNVNFKLQKGDKPTSYSKYGEGTLNIEQSSKNKLINSSFRENTIGWSLTNNGTTAPEITEKLGQKCLHITGELQKAKYFGQYIQTRVEKVKTYTLSAMVYLENYVPGTTNPFISFYTDGKTIAGSWTSGIQTLKGYLNFNNSNYDYSKGFVKITSTFKIKEDTDLTKALGVFIYARDFTGDLYVYDVQLEEGTEATNYEEYFNNTYTLPLSEPLRSLPNGVKDTLEADGIHRRVGRDFFKAITTIEENSGLKFGTYLVEHLGVLTRADNINMLCTKAKCQLYPHIENSIYLIGVNKKTIVIFGSSDDTVETFNTKFAGTEFLYELETETIEPYTEEQKKIISSMVTEKGTNIFNINENTGIEAVEYEGLYPETVNYKYVVFKYTVYQLVVTGVDSEGVEVQEIKDTGCYYYQAIPLEKFKKMKVKIKYERG